MSPKPDMGRENLAGFLGGERGGGFFRCIKRWRRLGVGGAGPSVGCAVDRGGTAHTKGVASVLCHGGWRTGQARHGAGKGKSIIRG